MWTGGRRHLSSRQCIITISKHSINRLQIISFIFIRWMRLCGGLYHELIKLLETWYFHLKDLFLDFVDFATALNCILLRVEIPYQPQSLKQIFRYQMRVFSEIHKKAFWSIMTFDRDVFVGQSWRLFDEL